MLDFSFGEIALVVFVALIVVGPKDLPNLLRKLGHWVGQLKSITDEFRQGFKEAMHETSMHDAEKDLYEIHNEIKYIRDQNGKLQRVFEVSDFVDESKPLMTDTKQN